MNTKFNIIKPAIIQENMMSNPDLIKQFLTLYQSQIPIDFKALKEAISQRNYKEIANKAHHIKPTMVYIGANQQQSKLQKLEALANLKNDIEIGQLFTELDQDVKILIDEIEIYLKNL
ncbi:hypothetical protein HP439_14150 [Sphingobacterium shayense]|uniref:Hpt domain-containing protein n=1 Tax=Sphingobacterium shayense TaxID=626343 RepID=UPI00155238F9|nr:hypothetical protein [Sphingobacterium shayense]NQD71865.1 hypothetical protein [Sphingobacterium shayense]